MFYSKFTEWILCGSLRDEHLRFREGSFKSNPSQAFVPLSRNGKILLVIGTTYRCDPRLRLAHQCDSMGLMTKCVFMSRFDAYDRH